MGLLYLTYLLSDLNRTQFKNNAVASWKKVINNYNNYNNYNNSCSHGQEYFSLPVPVPEPSLPSHHLFPPLLSLLQILDVSLALSMWPSMFSSVQFSSLSRVHLFATPWTTALQPYLSITNSLSLLKLMSIVSVMPSNHFILCHLFLLLSTCPSIRVFSNELALRIRWPK